MSGRVVHFELPYDDAERAQSFYADVFGWNIQPMPEMQYTIVSTGPATDQGMPAEPGYIGGGMTQRGGMVDRPVITIAVDDINDALERIPEDLRIPWVLHRVEQLSLPETAAACEISLATVKRRIADAEERIQRRLEMPR